MLSLFGPEQMASNVTINIVESDSQIEKMILRLLVKEANKILNKVKNNMVNNVKPVVRKALNASRTIESLRNGVLKADFGLTRDPTSAIIDTIVNSVEVRATRLSAVGSSIKGGLTLTVQPTDYAFLTTNPTIGGQAIKGGVMPWLDWLLVSGDAIIIANFGVEYGPYGRSGGGRMVEEKRPFKVNTNHSGTIDNNFITRAVDEHKLLIIDAIEKSF